MEIRIEYDHTKRSMFGHTAKIYKIFVNEQLIDEIGWVEDMSLSDSEIIDKIKEEINGKIK